MTGVSRERETKGSVSLLSNLENNEVTDAAADKRGAEEQKREGEQQRYWQGDLSCMELFTE